MILLSPIAWLNNNIMNAAEKLIYKELGDQHCVITVCIRNYSGPHFPAFGLNTKRYSVSLRIQSESGKMRTGITPNKDTFHAKTTNLCLMFKDEGLIIGYSFL